MKVTTARVMNGRLDVDAEAFPEGQLVKVVLLEDEPVRLTDEERSWLSGALEESRRGEPTDALAFLQELESAE
jgi:hypothetical protein